MGTSTGRRLHEHERRCLERVIGAIVVLLVSASPLLAQPEIPTRLSLHPGQHLAAARMAVKMGHPGTALSLLRPLVDQRPNFQRPPWGTAAYWLGQAHAARGDSAKAHAAWRAGVNALTADDRVDVALFAAYIRNVFEHNRREEFSSAAEAYLRLIERAGPEAPRTLRQQVAYVMLLWPEDQQRRLAAAPSAVRTGDGSLRPGAGRIVARWWRRHDPRPATPHNERVTEHLQRVTHARRHFRDEAVFLGLDDRGRIYVRLGPPSQRRELSSQRLAASVSIHSHFLPRNEYWHYDALGRHGHYIFVKDGHRYVLGGVVDLLPSDLRHRKKGTGVLTALALHDLYDALVPRVTEYAPLFDRISDEVARLSTVASQRSTTLTRMADANSDPGGTGARYARFPPSLLDRARRVDHTVAQRRAETVPASRSNVAMREGRLPVAVRLARFRAADGTTDVNAYWSIRCRPLPTDAVATPERRGEDHRDRQHHIRLTTRRYDRSYAANAVVRSAHTLPSCATPTPSTNARVVSTALPSPHGLQHFALQWDQLVQPHGAPPHTVRRAQSGVHWVDSLRALPATDDSLVLSDPVPLQAATVDSIPLRDDAGFQAQPYPFATIDPDMRLGVYLEAYNLTHDTDDRTRYTVAYAVRRDVPPDGWAGAFRAAKTETTSTRITRRGSSRTAHEYLEIDLRPFRHATALVLLIRVTDTVTDDTADRVLPFRVDDGLLTYSPG